ncbi:hypothetical protein [Pseudarthrobacter sp. Y6]|uniref:hypothetical protein n=1 Tax=Pseudarthrobacter sp. Y6 TaxID=3418422 RepID=UPI003CEB22C4
MHGPSQPRPPHVGRPTPPFRPGGCRRFLAVVLIAAVYMLAPARPGKGAASRTSTGIDTFANSAPIDAGLDLHQRSASLDDPLGAFTSGFQIQTMVQDSNNVVEPADRRRGPFRTLGVRRLHRLHL